MERGKRWILLCLIVFCITPAINASPFFKLDGLLGQEKQPVLALEKLQLTVPPGWQIHQKSRYKTLTFMGFENKDQYVRFYAAQKAAPTMDSLLGDRFHLSFGYYYNTPDQSWQIVEGLYDQPYFARRSTRRFVTLFLTKLEGTTFYGYSVASSQIRANANVMAFLNASQPILSNRSLTGPEFVGKKYYFGWGAASSGDPQMMHNEVKYDVLHTHDIFTENVGGNYIGEKIIGPQTSGSTIRSKWQSYHDTMTWNDMYVQYSSGHGSHSGLGVGVSYDEMRDAALKMAAKEIIILTMACYSGNLVNSFNQKKSIWQNWNQWGRTLMVMSSSSASDPSSTGPGTDPAEPGGGQGSAGSAFGHALWKALIGNADGHGAGVKDGYLSIGEIIDFTTYKTKQVGGHTPQVTGAYNIELVMARVPSIAFINSMKGGTQGMSKEEVMIRIQELDQAMRVH